MAKEEAGKIKANTYLRRLNHTEALQRMFRNIQHMEVEIKGGCAPKVVTKNNSFTTEYTKKRWLNNCVRKKMNGNIIKQNLASANLFPPLSSMTLDITEKEM